MKKKRESLFFFFSDSHRFKTKAKCWREKRGLGRKRGSLAEDGKDVFFTHEDQILLVLNVDLSAAILSQEHTVSNLDNRGNGVAVLVERTSSNSNDLSLIALLHSRVREHDATDLVDLGLDAAHKDAVKKGEDS